MAKIPIHRLRDDVITLGKIKIDKKSDNLAQMINWMGFGYGHRLYSPVYGFVRLLEINDKKIKVKDKSNNIFEFTLEGKIHEDGEIVLFPDKDKVWKPVPLPAYPPQRRVFVEQNKLIASLDIENSSKFIEFMASTASEIDLFFNSVINSESYWPNSTKEQKEQYCFYSIYLKKQKNYDKNRYDVIIHEKKIPINNQDEYLQFPPLFCFSSHAALMYFLNEYRYEIFSYLRGICKALNFPFSFILPEYDHAIEQDILTMRSIPYTR